MTSIQVEIAAVIDIVCTLEYTLVIHAGRWYFEPPICPLRPRTGLLPRLAGVCQKSSVCVHHALETLLATVCRPRMRCVLVSCCGLPAAGKTTFCLSIAAGSTFATPGATDTATDTRVERDNSGCGPIINGGPQIWVSHVCFDEYINSARRRRRQRSRSSNDNKPSSNAQMCSHLSPGSDVQRDKKDQGGGVESREKARLNLDRQAGADERDTRKESATYPLAHGGKGKHAVESQRATETTSHWPLPEPAGGSEGGEDGARWWHDGRRAAMAELEALAKGAESGGRAGAETAVNSDGTASSSCAMLPAMLSPETRTGFIDRARLSKKGAITSSANSPPKPTETSPWTEVSTVHVVLADDNMHFRSMRHEVFRLARKCAFEFVAGHGTHKPDMSVDVLSLTLKCKRYPKFPLCTVDGQTLSLLDW